MYSIEADGINAENVFLPLRHVRQQTSARCSISPVPATTPRRRYTRASFFPSRMASTPHLVTYIQGAVYDAMPVHVSFAYYIYTGTHPCRLPYLILEVVTKIQLFNDNCVKAGS